MLKRVGHYIFQILEVQYFVDMVSVSSPINFVCILHMYQSILIKLKLFLLIIDIPEKKLCRPLRQYNISPIGPDAPSDYSLYHYPYKTVSLPLSKSFPLDQ